MRFVELLRGLLSRLFITLYNAARQSSVVQWLSRLVTKNRPPSYLPAVASVERVSARVFRVLAQNPGYHTLQGTNTYLVTGVDTDEHVLVDAGEASTAAAYLQVLFDEVFPLAKTRRLRAIVLTHGHHDHQGGVRAVLAELARRDMTPLPEVFKRRADAADTAPRGFACRDIAAGQVFAVDKYTHLRAMLTPGHTADHASLVLDEDNAFFSGDCVLGCGTAVFENLHEYMNSLKQIKRMVEGSSGSPKEIHTIYPGHGPVIYKNALHKIDDYIFHRNQREEQILEALRSSGQWKTSLELVRTVYGTIPLGVVLSAQNNLVHHLEKLVKDEKVRFSSPDLWCAVP